MIRVNLLSPEKKVAAGSSSSPEQGAFPEEKKAGKLNIPSAVATGLITFGLIGFLYITQSKTLEEKTNLLNDLNAKKTTLKNVENTLTELETAKNDLKRKVGLISTLRSQQQSTVKMMDAVSNALPEWVWLTSLGFSGNRLNIAGKAIHNNLIADFINNLKASNNFSDVQFQGSTKQGQGGVDVFSFTLNGTYLGEIPPAKENKSSNKAG
jgi:type IV pilus assembly protein PilN